jgi:RNA polymerase sigma-70 factor, ECF subfamily
MPTTPSAELIRRAQDGDVNAFGELTERHSTLAYRRALSVVANRDDALDICQDAFLAAWQGIGGFRAQSSFSTWLYRIVTTKALTHLRHHMRRATQPLDRCDGVADPSPGPADQTLTRDAARALRTAIGALPTPQRTVLLLHAEHLRYANIAAATHSTVPAVRSHLHRGRRSLRASLARRIGSEP